MKADIILADPAWHFRTYSDKGRGRSPKYRTEAIEQIASLPVADLAADNCVLFMWVTWPFLFDAPAVVAEWGFTYRTLGFEWWKLNKRWYKYLVPLINNNHDYSHLLRLFAFGNGYYTRANSEPCLLCVKGRMPVEVKNERNFIISPLREPGRKPDEQYGKIEALYPQSIYPNRVELYAREKHPGWVSLGDEIDGRDLVESIPALTNQNT